MGLDQYLRFLMALIVVLIMIVLTIWALKRVGMFTAGAGLNTKRRRLSVIEAIPLDTRRRLVLVRRDGIEHLLLLGVHGDLVVETGIGASFTADLKALVADKPAVDDAGADAALADKRADGQGGEPIAEIPAA